MTTPARISSTSRANSTSPSSPTDRCVPADPLGEAYARHLLGSDEILRLGQVFTPPAIVRLMLDLADVRPGHDSVVLDPACGTGAILLGAAVRMGPQAQLHGLELDPHLASLARLNLQSWSSQTSIIVGDALARAEELAGRFDRVVSNPPYVGWHRIDPAIRRPLEAAPYLGCPLSGRPAHHDRQPDLALYFVLLGLHALRPGGRLVYLLPSEWLTADRAAPLRERLLGEGTVRQVVVFDEDLSLFAGSGPGGSRIQTSSMLLVVDRAPAPPGHEVEVARVSRLDAASQEEASRLARWLLGGMTAEHLAGSGETTSASETGHVRGWKVPQQAWRGRRWQVRVEVPGKRSHARPPEHPLNLELLAPLASIPGIRVVGGHQPIVAWLSWLELDAPARAEVAEGERAWLLPAVGEARNITFPVLGQPERWWAFLPRGLPDEEAVRRVAPSLYGWMAAGVDRALGGGSRPARWWEFPNPRNLELFLRPGPRLLAARTAPVSTLAWDDHGHVIKGTNTMVTVAPGGPLSVTALFGLLNSEPVRRWAAEHGRSYHGKGIKQEPRDVGRLPIPMLSGARARALLAALEAEVGSVIGGKNCWIEIHRLASELYMYGATGSGEGQR